jgi:hypothetical protein
LVMQNPEGDSKEQENDHRSGTVQEVFLHRAPQA